MLAINQRIAVASSPTERISIRSPAISALYVRNSFILPGSSSDTRSQESMVAS